MAVKNEQCILIGGSGSNYIYLCIACSEWAGSVTSMKGTNDVTVYGIKIRSLLYLSLNGDVSWFHTIILP